MTADMLDFCLKPVLCLKPVHPPSSAEDSTPPEVDFKRITDSDLKELVRKHGCHVSTATASLDFAESKKATRSTAVFVINKTKQKLRRLEEPVKPSSQPNGCGMWSNKLLPPDELAAADVHSRPGISAWSCESSGFMTGATQASVKYKLGDYLVLFKTSTPYSGKNSAECCITALTTSHSGREPSIKKEIRTGYNNAVVFIIG